MVKEIKFPFSSLRIRYSLPILSLLRSTQVAPTSWLVPLRVLPLPVICQRSMVSRSTKKKETVQVTVKDEGDTHESANNSNESMRSRLRGFAYTSTESGAMGSPSNSEVKVEAKISIKSTKKRKRSPSPLSSSLPAPPKPKAHKTELETSHPAPKNWEITYRAIEEMRKEKTAPVDHMGCHMPMLELKLDPRVYSLFLCSPLLVIVYRREDS